MSSNDLVIVVDDKDNIIDHVPRRVADKQHLRYRITGIWVENPQGQVLIAQRGLEKSINPGLWGPAAAGTVDAGQSYLENAIQEIQEELGLLVTENDLEQVDHLPASKAGQRRYMTIYRTVISVPIEDIKFGFPEVNAVKWVDKRSLFDDIKQNPQNYISHAAEWENEIANW
jgi:isopentenyldiphosphate isomerase